MSIDFLSVVLIFWGDKNIFLVLKVAFLLANRGKLSIMTIHSILFFGTTVF